MSTELSWNRLRDARLVAGAAPPTPERDPWPLQLLQGAGGWLGAIFLFGSLAIPLALTADRPAVLLVLGIMLAAGAATLLRQRGGIVLTQFAVAGSLAAQAMCFAGLTMLCDDWGPVPAIAGAVISVLLLCFTPQMVHRWWCAAIAGGALLSLAAQHHVLSHVTGVVTFATAMLLLRSPPTIAYHSMARAIGLGLVAAWSTMFAGTLAERRFVEAESSAWLLPAVLEAAAVMGTVAVMAYQARSRGAHQAVIVLAALAPAALCLVIPGASLALVLVLVAIAERDRLVLAIGIIGLLVLIWVHYQLDQQTPLITKAFGLGAIGAACLVLRVAVRFEGRSRHA